MDRSIINNASKKSWFSPVTQMVLTEYKDGKAKKPIHLKGLK